MHTPITVPGFDLTLTPIPSLTARMWSVTDPDGRLIGWVRRYREDPGTRHERTRWGARTHDGNTPDRPFITRRKAVEFLTQKAGTQ